MQTQNTLFESELRKNIENQIAVLKDELAQPITADAEVMKAYAEYRRRVGKIEGLNLALELCIEVGEILAQR